MKVIGIIAEYNPFHNGHAYQIEEIKKRTGADYVVIAMSGDFVQRGTPAIIDKYARTKMALSCGADLVIELPVLWATASAEAFAMAGVTLFEKMGCVDSLCFGAETDNLSLLSALAEILAEEPDEYKTLLASYLKEGLTFPTARSKALVEYLSTTSEKISSKQVSLSAHNALGEIHTAFDSEAVSSILNTPNNILAIEYLKALKRRGSSITPYVIKREGAGYHEDKIRNAAPTPTASATAIRKVLSQTASAEPFTDFQETNASIPVTLGYTMPEPAFIILNDYLTQSTLLHANDLSSILGYKLLTSSIEELTCIGDSNPDIANRLFKNRMCFSSFEQFCEENKSKDITYTRMNRILLHLILNIKNQDYQHAKNSDYIPYLRILGFKAASSALLKALKTSANAPVISKLADATNLLDNDALWLLEKDIFAADLYEQICSIKKETISRSEYTREIVRL